MLRGQGEYGEVLSDASVAARDRWWRNPANQSLSLCRTTREDSRACGALFARFEKIDTNPPV